MFRLIKIIMPLLVGSIFLSGCAGPKPVLQVNAYLESVGQQKAQEDIAECHQRAEKENIDPGETRVGRIAKTTSLGALGGAVVGAIGGITSGTSGIAALVGGGVLGIVGAVFGAVTPLELDKRYLSYVDSCLREKGYEPTSWRQCGMSEWG